ncbi:putative receptor-type adenylate cyclase [Trypanosoma cruzi]|nr:putative receptor-type adenylate cyclase [Trypanosoma cruzi]
MMQDVVVAQLAMGSTLAGADAAKAPQDDHDGTTVKFRTLSTSAAGAIDALLSEMSARRVHFASGVVTGAMLEMEGVTFIDPLPLEPRLNGSQRNMIRLSLTLEQQLFVLAEYLGNASGGSAHAVIRSGEAAAMADVLRRSLLTFGVSLAATRWWTTCRWRAMCFWWAFQLGMPVRLRGTCRRTVVCACSCSWSLRCCMLSLLLRSVTVRVRTVLCLRRACRTGTTGVQRRRPPESLLLLCRGRKTGRRCH